MIYDDVPIKKTLISVADYSYIELSDGSGIL